MVVTILYILLIFWIIQKSNFFKIEGIRKIDFHLAFVVKLFAASSLYYIYTEFYRDRHLADIFKFYDDSKVISDAFYTNPKDFFSLVIGLDFNEKYFDMNYYIDMNHWETSYKTVLMNESRLIIKLNALFNVIGFNHYSFNVISFLMIGYIGIVMIIKSLLSLIKIRSSRVLLWSIILFPSIVLWSSGILKEPITFLSIGMIIYGFQSVINRIHITKSIILIITGSYLLFMIKFYVFVCFFPSIIVLIIVLKWGFNPIKTISISCIIILSLIISFSYIFSDYSPIGLLSRKQNDFIGLAEFYNSGSYFSTYKMENNINSFLKSIPAGFFNGFFRPLPNDISKPIHLLPMIENLFLYIFGFVILLKSRKLNVKLSSLNKNIIYCSLFFCLLLFTLTGMSTPVIGALVRYKIPGFIFIIISLNIVYDNIQIQKK